VAGPGDGMMPPNYLLTVNLHTAQPSGNCPYSVQRIGRQFYDYSKQYYDNTCGFWVFAIALFLILGTGLHRLPSDITDIKCICASLWTEYQNSEAGGISRHLVCSLMEPLDRHLRTRIGNAQKDLVRML
jgi:hypothetical protein